MDKSANCGGDDNKVNKEKKQFICGVIEGFYGRPWTSFQRNYLFGKLKKWGMDSYVYAPKDDYKHRAYWRELYTVEEADHLSGLIAAAKEHGIMFYYALSPGLDMTYSSQKEILTLKRKLEQVSQFGCEAFALLFDDIESELSKADKEVFQTFANAQVSVTNEIYTHLGSPHFLFCPTQYCSTRAIPTVQDSEYLNTLGSKLNHDIDIMWTGNKVISKHISLESIQEVTEVLRRPPVIWDNLHANDYDQKRVFLGPYSGRSPELIPHLRGVMTNPNCEFHANTVAIHTLAMWSKCSIDSKVNSSISADIKLETGNEDSENSDDLPEECILSSNVYHPRIALKNAIMDWLPEFFIKKEAWGPISKPQPQVTMVLPIIPIIPSINTCMSLTTTTTTTSTKTITSSAVPEVNTAQLQALADVCSTVDSAMHPISNPVMNSLVSPTKVVTNDDIVNPIPSSAASNIELPKKIPISLVPVPIMHNAIEVELAAEAEAADVEPLIDSHEPSSEEISEDSAAKGKNGLHSEPAAAEDDVPIEEIKLLDAPAINEPLAIELDEQNLSPLSNEPMECSSSLASQNSPKEDALKTILAGNTVVESSSAGTETILGPNEDVVMSETASLNEFHSGMQVESSETSPLSNADEMRDDDDKQPTDGSKINLNDLHLLCDLFYLPFEHGSRGYKLLNEFNWLKANSNVLLSAEAKKVLPTTVANAATTLAAKPEIVEWLQRAEGFSSLCNGVQELLTKIANCANKEICHDLFSYVWDIAGALSLLNAFVKWLGLGQFPQNVYSYTQGSYTWFSKGWKETFMSGDQEPWVFRGGLIADLQRLMPVDSGNDLFLYKLPEFPTSTCYSMRPYTFADEADIMQVSTKAFIQQCAPEGEFSPLPDSLRDLIADSTVGPFITLSPELCVVVNEVSTNAIVGYAAAALDVNAFSRNIEMCWLPEMREKYGKGLMINGNDQFTESNSLNSLLKHMLDEWHVENYECPTEVSNAYPAVMTVAVLTSTGSRDYGLEKRLLIVALAVLRANGCFGVHIRIPVNETNQQYTRMGFAEVFRDSRHVYLARRF